MDIRADIIDITSDTPRRDDHILVDTNVLFWWFYPDQPTHVDVAKQKRPYDAYFEKLAEVGASLHYCQASLVELAHVIETTKLATYNEINQTTHRLKHYRHQESGERASVIEAISICWESIKSIATPINVTYDERAIQQALLGLTAYQVDAYDYIQIDAMQTQGITKILTDYATVADIEVFTAFYKIINQARNANKLIRRP